MPISFSNGKPAQAGDMSKVRPSNEPGEEQVMGFVMSKVEFARKRARKDMVWLLIAMGIFACALTLSMMNLGSGRAIAGNSCVTQCKAQFGQCVVSSGDRSGCQQELLTCLDRCKGG